MEVKKHLFITGNSNISWKDAIVKTIAEASKTIDYLSNVKIVEQRANIDGNKIGVIIDRIARVVSVNSADVKAPPQMLSGIGTEYIQGVIRQENGQYLIMLDIRKLFDAKELQNIIDMK